METCRWCSRPLSDPLSVMFGAGPSCFAHEKRQHEQLRIAIADAPRRVIVYGDMPRGAAANWVTAFNQVDGMKASRRTTDTGEVQVYLLAAADTRSVHRRLRSRPPEET